ncbi:response regulator receiver domain-containing protein [Paucimonas lemoignei]|uniref:Response regulator receiver domain-containing protein n=1 Tax=Paucimonas lemoignei TaxID=29443 RepID=A0A4R3HW21_PAULE|nr:response regulator [Paucimonas lemoignei]TCS36285.1 response regulator receiver domain-containing protein [Paucimonas lemoignei]
MPDRILLVEDDPNDVELLLVALELNGLAKEIHVARDGAEALDYLFRQGEYQDRPAAHPSLVILDLKLPKVDGMEVLAAIRAHPDLKKLRVIIFTSSREEADILRSNALGADAYIVKAPGCANLIDAICKLAQLRHGQKHKEQDAGAPGLTLRPRPTLH